MNSLGVFLGQELARFNELIEVMKATLNDLQRAIKGIVVMSGPLENMYNCFLLNRVPPAWENAGYPCLKVSKGCWLLVVRIHRDRETAMSDPYLYVDTHTHDSLYLHGSKTSLLVSSSCEIGLHKDHVKVTGSVASFSLKDL